MEDSPLSNVSRAGRAPVGGRILDVVPEPDSAGGRPLGGAVRNTRPRDRLGRPLPYGSTGVDPVAAGVVRTSEETLAEAQRLLDAGLPFQAHEVLEEAWKVAPPAERDLWRGLAQVAVGVTHAARGNRRGASALLRRGALLLAPYEKAGGLGPDVPAVRAWAGVAAAYAEAGRPLPPGLVLIAR